MESLFNTTSYKKVSNSLGISGVLFSIVAVPLMINKIFPGYLLMLTGLATSSCYFVLKSMSLTSFIRRTIELGMAILVIGLIFFMMHWPGAESMSMVSSSMFLYLTLAGTLDLWKNKEQAYFDLQKLLLFALLGCCILTSYYMEPLPA
jgi:hypothetical protein